MEYADQRLRELRRMLEQRQALLYDRLISGLAIRRDPATSLAIKGIACALNEDELRFIEVALRGLEGAGHYVTRH